MSTYRRARALALVVSLTALVAGCGNADAKARHDSIAAESSDAFCEAFTTLPTGVAQRDLPRAWIERVGAVGVPEDAAASVEHGLEVSIQIYRRPASRLHLSTADLQDAEAFRSYAIKMCGTPALSFERT